MKSIISSLVKGKKQLWNFVFPNKVLGREASLGGIGKQALKIKLSTTKTYPHLDVSGFLNWEHYDEFTKEEKALVDALIKELNIDPSSL